MKKTIYFFFSKEQKVFLINKIFIDDLLLEEEYYKQQKNNLKIENINKDNFLLKIEGIIKPKENTSLLGMYESNGIITTQCEAEGFRRISFHSDRPDPKQIHREN